MKVSILSFSERGFNLSDKIARHFEGMAAEVEYERCKDKGLSAWTDSHFDASDVLVYVGSCGIAVRAIAGHVHSKTSDPAVIVVDELGTFCISLLSGHLGGANKYSSDLARSLGSMPVITTATDINHVWAVDTWAKSQNLVVQNPQRIKYVSARLLAGDEVGIKLPTDFEGTLPKGLRADDTDYDILVSHRTRGKSEALRLIPRVMVLGIGTRRGVDADVIEDAFEKMLGRANCCEEAIYKVCSIDLKKDEVGINSFCRRHNLPFETFTAQQLAALQGEFTPSNFVKSVTGVDNVCERSALLGSGEGGRIISGKNAGNGVTMALAMSKYELSFESEDK